MTDEVAALVLRDNYLQSQAISLHEARRPTRLSEHAHLIRSLELDGVLDRALEFLPTAEEIEERRQRRRGPDAAGTRDGARLRQDRAQQPAHPLRRAGGSVPLKELDRYFPDRSCRRDTGSLTRASPASREIIATATTNSIVNRMGPTFVARTQEDTGADAATVARAYTVAREVFDMRELWRAIEQLDNRIPATVSTR